MPDFRYYYSVPIYGIAVTGENRVETIFPKHLSAGHTHSFIEKSRGLGEKNRAANLPRNGDLVLICKMS